MSKFISSSCQHEPSHFLYFPLLNLVIPLHMIGNVPNFNVANTRFDYLDECCKHLVTTRIKYKKIETTGTKLNNLCGPNAFSTLKKH